MVKVMPHVSSPAKGETYSFTKVSLPFFTHSLVTRISEGRTWVDGVGAHALDKAITPIAAASQTERMVTLLLYAEAMPNDQS